MGFAQAEFTVTLTSISCCQCGLVFGIPTTLEASLRKSHKLFYCPAGHEQYFAGESEVERLKKQAEALQKKLEWAQRSAQLATEEATKVSKKLHSANEERKKLKKRIKEGMCPCCHVTFSNLEVHMKSQHPHFVESDE